MSILCTSAALVTGGGIFVVREEEEEEDTGVLYTIPIGIEVSAVGVIKEEGEALLLLPLPLPYWAALPTCPASVGVCGTRTAWGGSG